jgi:hypothetical protein
MDSKKSIPLAIFVFVLAVLACTINIGGPDYPDRKIPVSTQAVGDLETNIQTAVALGANTGQITFLITEAQMTSYIYYKLQGQSKPFIVDPQVYLQDDQIQIFGTAEQGYFTATVSIIITPSINEGGQLQITVTSVDFGPLPVPDGLKDLITSMISEAYTGSLGPVATGFRLEGLVVANGAMLLAGRIK